MEEECSDIGFDAIKLRQMINRLHKYYHKKDSVHDIQFLLDNISSFFLNDTFREKIKNFIEKNDDKIHEYGKDFFYEKGVFSSNKLERTVLARIKRFNLSYAAINELSKKEILDVLQINNRFKDNENINRRIIDVQ